MTCLRHFIILSLALLIGSLAPALSAQKESFDNKVVVIQIGEDSLSSKQGFGYISRIMKQASEDKARAIIFDLNTPGGLAWETSELMMNLLKSTDIATYAFVNNKAISAGALISVACDTIYMSPGSSIGAAGVVSSMGEEMDPMMRKKVDSAFGAITRSVVEEKGHNVELVKSMMIPSDEDREFGTVKLPKGELLSLSTKQATSLDENGNPLLAKGIVSSVDELLKEEHIEAPVIYANPTAFEQIAFWIAWISPILILAGMAGIYLEFKTPGFGIGGIIAIVAFGLFFFGNNIAGNLAGYEMIALFVLGVILLLVELFFVPGTLIAGITGIALILISLFGGMISGADLDYIVTTGDWSMESLFHVGVMPLLRLSIGLFGAAIVIMILMRYLPETRMFRRFSNDVVSGGQRDGEAVATASALENGAYGVALTELKPNGKALFNGNTFEVFSRQGILPKGTPLRVIEKRSFDFVVEKSEIRDSDILAADETDKNGLN